MGDVFDCQVASQFAAGTFWGCILCVRDGWRAALPLGPAGAGGIHVSSLPNSGYQNPVLRFGPCCRL